MRYINAEELLNLMEFYQSNGQEEKAQKYLQEYNELQVEMNRD